MNDKSDKATLTRNRYSVSLQDQAVKNNSGEIIIEQAITLEVDEVGEFTLMCTPTDTEALAVGFSYSEGIIESIDDVAAIRRPSQQQPGLIGIRVKAPSRTAVRRNMIVASSCGLCGSRTIERTLAETRPAGFTLTLPRELLLQMPDRLFAAQRVYPATRAAHAAGIFNQNGEIVAFAEDIGRHNALDKAIGKCLLDRVSIKGLGVILSSRASFEMVSKAARAGLEMVLASGAVTSLAIEAAELWNLTLCGPTRNDGASIHTHPERITLNDFSITRKFDQR
ncbi:MAG: formate dehydrogenase accessory sulfurtransferase FdhD [Deltaproteobacteria bacterium]|nr:formate dehydrogenase accessory sulfurtransferase FdhD [Deltaproteobacteria bacterium]